MNRIYNDMEEFYLKAPEYDEPNDYAVQLKLENNYESRKMRLDNHVDKLEEKLDEEEFNSIERKILSYLYSNGQITVKKRLT